MSGRNRVGVVLAGCGYLDGAEIQEAVLTLLYLDQGGAEVVCMAPNMPQAQVVDHLTGKVTSEKRNVLVESARIVRGRVVDIATVDPAGLDALILPGGYGAAKNLCDFAFKGAGMVVHPAVAALVGAVHRAGKPVGAWCIAPAVLAKLFPGVTVTIGDDAGTASALESMGAHHQVCGVANIIVDARHKIITTPAYMLGPSIADVAAGIEQAVNDMLEMLDNGNV